MRIVLEQMPVEAVSFAEFAALGEFLAHEKEFLTGMAVLISVEEPQIGELLPHVAGHFVEKRIFTVDDLVVRKRQHKIFGESIQQGKGELVLVKLAVNGILGEISERVVHPAHVPLEAEAEAPEVSGAGDAGPRC